MKLSHGATLAICILAVAAATADEVWEPDSMNPEHSQVIEDVDALVMEEEAAHPKANKKANPKTAGAARTLKHIADLRAYAIAASDKIEDFSEDHGHADAGLVRFVSKLSEVVYKTPPPPPPSPELPNNIKGIPVELPDDATLAPAHKKKMQGNVVLQYAHAMRQATHQYNRGLGPYLLGHLDKAVLAGGKGKVLQVFHHAGGMWVTLDSKVVGLTHRPQYFIRLAVPMSKFLTVLKDVHEQCNNADAGAAAMWLKEGSDGEYKSFLAKEEDKANALAKKSNDSVVKAALESIKTWYKDRGSYAALEKGGPKGLAIMEELPAAGLRGTKLVKQLDIPSERQLEKAAAEAAKKWVQGQSGDLAEKEVDKVEGKPPLELLGCFKDSKDRDLPRMMKSGSKDSCKAQCKDYKYFGRQWTKECWCGNSYGKHGKAEGCDCDSETNMGGWKNCVYPTKRGEAIQLPEKPPPTKPQPKPKPKPKPKPASKPACKHIISNSKVKYSVEPGVNLRGPGGNEDVRKVHTANVAACSAKCDAEPKCQYFVFIAGGDCWLKKNLTHRQNTSWTKKHCVSGIKCAAPKPAPKPAASAPVDRSAQADCGGSMLKSWKNLNKEHNGRKANASDCKAKCQGVSEDNCKCFVFSAKKKGTCSVYSGKPNPGKACSNNIDCPCGFKCPGLNKKCLPNAQCKNCGANKNCKKKGGIEKVKKDKKKKKK